MPRRFTNMLSVSSVLVNNSAETYNSGLTFLAQSNRYSATCNGVLWQLSKRTPSNMRAVVSTYSRMCCQRYGLSSGLSPNLPQTKSRTLFIIELQPAAATLTLTSIWRCHPTRSTHASNTRYHVPVAVVQNHSTDQRPSPNRCVP